MLLSRRQMIQAGAAGRALTLLPSSLLAPGRRARLPDPPRSRRRRLRLSARAPCRPGPRLGRPGHRPRLLARARAAFDRHRSQLRHIDVVGIADFSQGRRPNRASILLDTNSGRVTRHLVAHGRGSDPAHTGFLQRFSNAVGSEATSNGAYVTSEYYPGRYGRSMRVRGLDYSNTNAEARAIVVHSAWYAEPAGRRGQGRLGRSEGCFALPYQQPPGSARPPRPRPLPLRRPAGVRDSYFHALAPQFRAQTIGK